MGKRILAINPGSTSTKVALYDDRGEVFSVNIEHSDSELSRFDTIQDQYDFRKDAILRTLDENGVDVKSLDAAVGRGGMIAGIESGGYLVNELLKERILRGDFPPHASNLGALLADAIARPLGIPAYIYDAVAADEMIDIAHITGLPEIKRQPYSHVLNTRAMARKYAESVGRQYEDMNFLVCHIGGGVSVNAHEKGRIIDSIEDDGGPFSIERAGVMPLTYVLDLAYSGAYTKQELTKKLRGNGGVKAHLGTHDLREVERRIADGDEYAERVFLALAYQISKGIGELAPVLAGRYDAIILTGGAAHSTALTDLIRARVSFIAPVFVLPGENEMESLAFGAFRILSGAEEAKIYR